MTTHTLIAASTRSLAQRLRAYTALTMWLTLATLIGYAIIAVRGAAR